MYRYNKMSHHKHFIVEFMLQNWWRHVDSCQMQQISSLGEWLVLHLARSVSYTTIFTLSLRGRKSKPRMIKPALSLQGCLDCTYWEMFEQSCVDWIGELTHNQIMKWSSRLIGESQLSLQPLYARQLQRLASSICSDDSHPLASEFQHMPSAGRFRVSRAKTTHYKNSFVPVSPFKKS